MDCPPGTGDEPISIIQTLKWVAGAVIVTTPQDIAIIDVKKSIDFIQKLNVPILGIVENMKFFRCPHCHKITPIFQGNQLEKMIFEYSLDLLAELEIDPAIATSADQGKPYIYFNNKQPSAKALMEATLKIIEKVESSKESAQK